jgi:hypothetical protein
MSIERFDPQACPSDIAKLREKRLEVARRMKANIHGFKSWDEYASGLIYLEEVGSIDGFRVLLRDMDP